VDDINSLTYVIGILLVFSALFSGSEVAFFSLTKIHIKKLEKEKSTQSKNILRLLKKPKQLLITILLGNTLINILASSLATYYAIMLSKTYTVTQKSLTISIVIIIMTVLILIFGEILPKLIAFTMPIKIASITSIILIIFKFLLYPIILILEIFTNKISKKKSGIQGLNSSLSHEDIRNIVKSDSNNHPLEESEKRIIDSIFRFSSTEVKEIMVPRVDIMGVESSCELSHIKKTIVDSGYSRIPVYKKSIDEIIGIIYAKDLILHPEKTTIHDLQRKVFFIPENMKIQTLLNHFQIKKIQIAIVVDEYGGTSGLVTLEDILEQLVGEIMDEYDEEQPLITKLNAENFLISGMIQISELNREFDLDISEEFDNLAEFLYAELNHIPKKNERYTFNDLVEFTITQIKKQRINFVKLRLLNNDK